MIFEDYGIVARYNGEYGVIFTGSYKAIFIHTNNKISKDLSQDDFALIGSIKYNANRKREEGFNIIGFKANEKDTFLGIILNNWRNKFKIEFDDHIKWILNNGNNWSFKQILNIDYEYWHNSKEFNSWVFTNSDKYKPETEIFILRQWSLNKVNDANLEVLFNRNDISLIDKLFNIRYDFIFDSGFYLMFSKLSSTNREHFIDRVIINLNNSDSTLFICILDWILRHSYSKAIDKVIKIHGDYMVETDSIIEFIINNKYLSSSKMVCKLIHQHYIKLNISDYNSHIKFLLDNSCHEIVFEIINSDIKYWSNCSGFIEDIKRLKGFRKAAAIFIVNKLKYEYENSPDDNTKLSVTESNIDNIIWVIKQTNLYYFIKILGHIIIPDRKAISLLTSHGDVFDLINEEIYLFHAWKYFESDPFLELETWLLEHANINIAIEVLSRKYNYKRELVQNWYNAFFPNNDTLHYNKWAKSHNWSDDLKKTYISDKLENIRNRFLALFVKQKEVLEIKPNLKSVHSATDLATYQFCPASYVINATHNLSCLENDLMFIGREEHEKVRLLEIKNREQLMKKYEAYGDNNEYRDLIKLILRSDSIHEGHNDKNQDSKIFYSKKKNISMCPDYIFKDKENIFVVEEKYTFNKYDNVTSLYLNHRVQALAYLYGLSQLNVSTAYVVYWFYDWKEKAVNHVRVFKLVKNEANLSMLTDVFNTVNFLNRGSKIQLRLGDINANKCIKCQAFAYCKYKTREFKSITLQ